MTKPKLEVKTQTKFYSINQLRLFTSSAQFAFRIRPWVTSPITWKASINQCWSINNLFDVFVQNIVICKKWSKMYCKKLKYWRSKIPRFLNSIFLTTPNVCKPPTYIVIISHYFSNVLIIFISFFLLQIKQNLNITKQLNIT